MQMPLFPGLPDQRRRMPAWSWQPPTAFLNLAGAKRIAIDVETCDEHLAQLGPGVRRGAYIVGLSVGIDQGPRHYYPIAHQGGGNLNMDNVLGWARSALNAFDGEICGMQLLYDLDFLAQVGVTFPKVKRFLDIGNAEPLIDEHKVGQYNLDALGQHYLQEGKTHTLLDDAADASGFAKTQRAIKQNLWRLHSGYVGPYAEGDVDLPLRILPKQLAIIEQQGLGNVFDLETRLIPVLLAMRRRGVRVNENRLDEIRAKLALRRDDYLAKLRHLAGPKVDFMRAEALGAALVDRGIRVPRTKTGKFSISKTIFSEFAGDDLVDTIAAGRRIATVISTFLDGNARHLTNGRLHTIFNQLKSDEGGAIGRLSSEHPNLQNVVARDEELAPLVREAFEPDEGEDWESQDQAQAEYRLMAHYAVGPKSKEFRQRYRDDPRTDYHVFCSEMLHIDPGNKFLRKRVKGINFAKGYGAQAPRLALLLGCSIEEAKAFIAEHERALPFVPATFNRAKQVAEEKGFIRSLSGRRARFDLWEPITNRKLPQNQRLAALPREKAEKYYGNGAIVRANTYMALNRLLQLGNADITKKSLVDIWEAGICNVLGAPLLTIHDDNSWSVPRTKEAAEAAAEAKRLTEVAYPLRVPFIVDVERGPNWGRLGKVK